MSNPVLSQSITATQVTTLQTALDSGTSPNFDSAVQQVKLGTMLSPLKVTFASLTSASVQNITTAAAILAATIKQNNAAFTPATGQTLPAIQMVKTLRVTAGSAAAGSRVVTDIGGTPVAPSTYAGVALLSDDGTSLTFEAAVTGFVLEYFPQSPVALSTALTNNAPQSQVI